MEHLGGSRKKNGKKPMGFPVNRKKHGNIIRNRIMMRLVELFEKRGI